MRETEPIAPQVEQQPIPIPRVEPCPATDTQVAQEQASESPKAKRKRLDRKDGHGFVKDTTPGIESTLELIPQLRPILTEQSQCGKGMLTSEAEVLSYPDILDTTHEFGALL